MRVPRACHTANTKNIKQHLSFTPLGKREFVFGCVKTLLMVSRCQLEKIAYSSRLI
jgi:hypothetical protein